jgi:peptide/nickel transport system substrate-binding protein
MKDKIIVLIVLLLSAFGCKTDKRGDKQVFHYNEPTGIASLDPAFAKNQAVIWPVHQLFNTLVETDSNLLVAPSLAKSWELSADRLTYTFVLRNDVFFHDNDAFPGGKGRKMVAADVQYSFSRLVDPSTASPGSWIFNTRVDSVQPFLALNDSTFQLRLRRPFTPILGVLSNVYCSIVPKEVVEKYGKDFRSHPCGTGPFQFKSWEEGQALILVKNEKYFETENGNRLPYLDAIKVTFYDNRATEFLLFQQGQLDFINDIESSFKDEVLSKKGELKDKWKGKIVLNKHSYLNTEYFGIIVDSSKDLVKQSPLRLRQIRQAINYGFDRRKMMMYLRNSIGTAAESGFIPAGLPSFDTALVQGYHYDPSKSRQLLKEAGFPDGRGLPVIRLLTIPVYADLGSFVSRQLEDVGIKTTVEVVQKSFLLEQTAKSQALFFRASWIADYPDAENYLSVFYGKNPAPPNYTRYHNPEYDQWYEKAMEIEDDSARFELYRKMDRLIIHDAPVVPLWYDQVIHLVNPNVKGFTPNSLNVLELRRARIEK